MPGVRRDRPVMPASVTVWFSLRACSRAVGDCPDWEDDRILDLAAAVVAFLIVSGDADLTSMSPWRVRPVIEPPQFAPLVDASRRARKRQR